MPLSDWKRPVLLFITILFVILTTFFLVVVYHEDADNRVQFVLEDQDGLPVTQQKYSGTHQLVFFGFTSCNSICPTQMSKLSRALHQLELSGTIDHITPIFISVDPERDTPQKIAEYLTNFHPRFVGLSGSRAALENAARSFKTFLAEATEPAEEDYQVTHSSVVYVVDPFSRIVDVIPFESGVEAIVDRVSELI